MKGIGKAETIKAKILLLSEEVRKLTWEYVEEIALDQNTKTIIEVGDWVLIELKDVCPVFGKERANKFCKALIIEITDCYVSVGIAYGLFTAELKHDKIHIFGKGDDISKEMASDILLAIRDKKEYVLNTIKRREIR